MSSIFDKFKGKITVDSNWNIKYNGFAESFDSLPVRLFFSAMEPRKEKNLLDYIAIGGACAFLCILNL
jgi:hypothetical protein